MTTRTAVVWALTISGLAFGAPHPKLIQEISLNQLIREPQSFLPSSHSTFDLVFSPDGKWIAVGVGRHNLPGDKSPHRGVSHVLLVSLGGDKQKIVQIDPGVSVWEHTLFWTPNSDAFAVSAEEHASLYSVPSGELWDGGKADPRLSLIQGFIDSEHGLARQKPRELIDWVTRPITLDTFDLSGRVVQVWTPPGLWTIDDVSPDQHSVAMTDGTNDPHTKTFVLDYRTKAVIQTWPAGGPFSRQSFAEAGKSVCAIGGHGRGSRHAQCWDVESGKKLAEFNGFAGGQPAVVSSHSSRIVLTHIAFFRGITEEYDMKSYKNRVVWDFRTGEEVVEWLPQSQIQEGNKLANWMPCAISPTGRYLAEGGNGILRIYEIP